jgi:2-oxoglutarate dehydrogenase E1 component
MLLGGMRVDDPAEFSSSASFLESLFEDYLRDPASVPEEWRRWFQQQAAGPAVSHAAARQAMLQQVQRPLRVVASPIRQIELAFQTFGHLRAQTDPLALAAPPRVPELELGFYGLTQADLDQSVDSHFGSTLGAAVAELERIYCGSVGYEFGYLPGVEREWVARRVEQGAATLSGPEHRLRLLRKVTAAEGLERDLNLRYVGQKRFSLEGSESLIPLLDVLVVRAAGDGVAEVVFGMAHRGRLNVLINLLGKSPGDLFAEFEGRHVAADHSGDVKYHLGFSSDIPTPQGSMHLAMAFNPSHLEIVDPVVEGSVRARQDRRADGERRSVLPVLIHGDAAVIAQGVVAETLNLSLLRGFTTGGTVHVVANNQVGFTVSDPLDARSSRYCSDVAKMIDAPVFHVNADDLDAVSWVAELAFDYRMSFRKDVFIDLVAYRRLGHNESDDPRVTQPRMYRKVAEHPGSRAVYAARLEREQLLAPGQAEAILQEYQGFLEKGEPLIELSPHGVSAEHAANWSPYLEKHWTAPAETGYPLDALSQLGERLNRVPEGFRVHPRLERILAARERMVAGEQPLDWGMAENLAYATLLQQGVGVRLTGQDSARGTFFHRHAIWHDQKAEATEERYCPLAQFGDARTRFEVVDSTLSEEAVLAFEYGYSSAEPTKLVIWEAQYGDFANGAQVVIDQFISAAESKWQRLSGMVLMLPHGYEGQGPEHSSARIERYLQLCAEDNLQVCVPSTPAQMFHLLRRQALRPYRHPLILISPKSLLRSRLSASPLQELSGGRFEVVIPDPDWPSGAGRVLLCSGKLYFELLEARAEAELPVALLRLEQLYPFPGDALRSALAPHPGASVVWVQEEPYNQGAWLALRDDLQSSLVPSQHLEQVSRPRSAAPAVGYASRHQEQQRELIEIALRGGVR